MSVALVRELAEELREAQHVPRYVPPYVRAKALSDALDLGFPRLAAAWVSLTEKQKRRIRLEADPLLPPEARRGGSERGHVQWTLETRIAFWLTLLATAPERVSMLNP